jgi:hypothetical protein
MASAALAAATICLPHTAAAQVEVDRIVGRVGDRILTLSDVRRAHTLHLVDDISSDDAVRRALEDRMLILGEMARAQTMPPPAAADLAARRAAWEASLGGPDRAADLLRQAGMPRSELDAWLRDDVLIRLYLERQFGRVSDADRQKAQADWIARLRQRAGL